jgi:hypothetical protein
VTLRALPRRNKRSAAIDALLSFLIDAPPPSSDFERRLGRTFGPGSLPRQLQRSYSSISIRPSGNMSLGIHLGRSTSSDPSESYSALEKVLADKLVKKCRLYEAAKRLKGLASLWLVVHYGRAFAINSPFEGIGIREGLGSDAVTSLQLIVNRAQEFCDRAVSQPFDRIIMFWDFLPRPHIFELWPRVADVKAIFQALIEMQRSKCDCEVRVRIRFPYTRHS